jgi:hypothetical protein
MKDAMGNDLKVGALVALSLERPLIFGRVTELKEGGMITGLKHGQAEMRPSVVVVTSNHPIAIDPREAGAPIGSILCLLDPAPPELMPAAANAAEDSKPN